MSHSIKIPLMEVYDRWGETMQTVLSDSWSMDSSDSPANLPYARLLLLGNSAKSHDLSGDECATNLSFEVQTFAVGQMALDTVYEIDAVSHEVMVSIGFRRTFGPELIENADTKIKRLVSRYTLVYTGYLLEE